MLSDLPEVCSDRHSTFLEIWYVLIDYWIIFDQATINKICIKDEYRRRGLAQKLLDICFKEVRENECMVITLEVRTSNEKAIKLYQKNGFDIVLTKPQYYSDGEDAYYMVKGVI